MINKLILIVTFCILSTPVIFAAYSMKKDIDKAELDETAQAWLDRHYPSHLAYYCGYNGGCAAQVDEKIITFSCGVRCKTY